MIRYLFAPVHPPFAAALDLPRTLPVPPASGLESAPTHPVPAAPVVALSFDDGPHPEGTPAILDVLAAHGARAIFFVVGEQASQRPQLLQRMHADGHAVALHGHHHRLHLRRTTKDLEQDFARGLAVIEDAIGQTPQYHRPPYGIYSPTSVRIARELELQPLLWSAWGKDWRRLTTPARIAGRVTRQLQAGDVILLHDADHYSSRGSHWRTVKALSPILAALESARLGTVSSG